MEEDDLLLETLGFEIVRTGKTHNFYKTPKPNRRRLHKLKEVGPFLEGEHRNGRLLNVSEHHFHFGKGKRKGGGAGVQGGGGGDVLVPELDEHGLRRAVAPYKFPGDKDNLSTAAAGDKSPLRSETPYNCPGEGGDVLVPEHDEVRLGPAVAPYNKSPGAGGDASQLKPVIDSMVNLLLRDSEISVNHRLVILLSIFRAFY